ncbi:TetR/AcrR family transcriptional regulator [Campylobacter fetus]|uniref:TetR/AcrR family transcriptional regulator n=1 Tax=Campylobacter fetus TaxID=196 RepID=UPI0011CBD0B5|nr:TetR/AcrR family transcriptional regulator [Campylobacter fetus]EAJ1232375.1 TetR/AcrR family transcriptional regulator [Campylobacter fetus]EAK0414196.1 TetR/AcrR family transcriptional regulator [Campylobacter fetus]TXF08763.1 TetR/AcrR family transcriptional regulator [Campylobacter fetus subsp. fetus]
MVNKTELAKILEIELRTLYNWEKKRPTLYKFLINNFQKNNENNSKIDILIEYFSKLSEKEQDYYISDIKTRILKKEIE